ncbi:hypothetical protein SK128_013499 [Halocaridina rubra]|uniref:ILEI/PANDER domain-containing protein n=1 Tax=Halocaridina rubra TaxID=373956 RepID=A0AAN8XMR3_HALRR
MEWRSLEVESKPINITLTISLPSGENVTKTFNANDEGLKALNVTKEEMEGTLAHADADGKLREVRIGSRRIPLVLNIWRLPGSMTYSYITVNKTYWYVSRLNYTHVSIANFTDDPTLKPLKIPLNWSLAPEIHERSLLNLTLISEVLFTSIQVNNDTVLQNQSEGDVSTGVTVLLVPFSGLYLRVLNPYTGRITLSRYFNTEEYFVDAELVDILEKLVEGRVAMLTSYYDASGRLGNASRKALEILGSFAAKQIRFRDCWVWVWQVGRGTLGEALVMNPNGVFSVPKTLRLHLVHPRPDSSDHSCPSWPKSEIWNKRRHFCDMYDVHADICSCLQPFQSPHNPRGLDALSCGRRGKFGWDSGEEGRVDGAVCRHLILGGQPGRTGKREIGTRISVSMG